MNSVAEQPLAKRFNIRQICQTTCDPFDQSDYCLKCKISSKDLLTQTSKFDLSHKHRHFQDACSVKMLGINFAEALFFCPDLLQHSKYGFSQKFLIDSLLADANFRFTWTSSTKLGL